MTHKKRCGLWGIFWKSPDHVKLCVRGSCAPIAKQGRRVLDGGLNITWGYDQRYWTRIVEPTSPRGRVWRLEEVCWLEVRGHVPAPRPGLYAAFFRVRQRAQCRPLLLFTAEWKANAVDPKDAGFQPVVPARPPAVWQPSEAVASWSHSPDYHEDNEGGWLLCHVGNIMVRESGAVGTVGDRREVSISFGGNNPHWCGNLDVDFAAIAPIRLSWGIKRVLMIGNIKGESSEADTGSLLSRLPPHVMILILDFSQPTLRRPPVETDGERSHSGDADGDGTGGGENESSINDGSWKVF